MLLPCFFQGRLLLDGSTLEQQSVIRGLFDQGNEVPKWDGRADDGQQVPPGHYIYRISLDTDEETEDLVGTLSLVY